MTEDTASGAWFSEVDPENPNTAREVIEQGSADKSADWPGQAVDTGFAEDEDEYYSLLHDTTVNAAREAVREQESADDQQLKHGIRAMDDCRRQANELAERVAEWAGSRGNAGTGIEHARELAARDPGNPVDREVAALAGQAVSLNEQADRLRSFVERSATEVAPNLAALAGPVLAARLVSLAGGLESLARKPSGTVQVLGAEDALFAHLRGEAPSPKHGVIYTHEYVRETPPAERGSAARALAGKLSIAARVDHYSGERRPELAADLEERIERVRARGSE